MLPMVLVLAGCFGGGGDNQALVTVMPSGEGSNDWSLPIQFTVDQDGRPVTDLPWKRPSDLRLPAGTYDFALYGRLCPVSFKLYPDDHVLISVTTYKRGRCRLTATHIPFEKYPEIGRSG